MVVTVQERPLPFPPDPPPNPGTGHPAPKPGLYSDRLKTNITWDNRLKRNVLEITLEKEEESFTDIGSESIARLFKTLGINIETEIEGYFQKSRSIQLWLANGVDLDRFCKNESIRVTDTIRTGFIRPAGKKEVTVTVSGLDFNTPDKFVMDYLREGTFRGKCNGDRKYQVDFTQSNITMGTYHIIDGSRVRIHYPGNKKTCGRCHKTADQCRGDAVAKSCEENQGVRVELQDHMKCLWERVGFHPHNFQLNGDEANDAIIKESSSFSPIINRPEPTEDEKNKFNGIALKNFPKETKKVDIIELLKTIGLPEGFPQERIVFGNHGNVEIRNLSAQTCQEIIKNIHFPESRKKYFGKPIYCIVEQPEILPHQRLQKVLMLLVRKLLRRSVLMKVKAVLKQITMDLYLDLSKAILAANYLTETHQKAQTVTLMMTRNQLILPNSLEKVPGLRV